jgi:Flp pilus assembly secretin CpaC
LQEQIKIDQQIADLQADILNQLAAQLDNGVITSTDYLTQTNAELLARQQLELHQLQLLQTQLNFLNERGDWFLVMSKK